MLCSATMSSWSVPSPPLLPTSSEFFLGSTLKDQNTLLEQTMRVILPETVSIENSPTCFKRHGQHSVWPFLLFIRHIRQSSGSRLNWDINTSVSVLNQEYRVAVHEESVVMFNDVLFKCNIQSHVTHLVTVSGWVNSEGETYSSDSGDNYGNCDERRWQVLQDLRRKS